MEETKKLKIGEMELVKPEPTETRELPDGIYKVKLEKPLEELEAVEVEGEDGTLIYYTTIPLITESEGKVLLRVKVGTKKQGEDKIREGKYFSEFRKLNTETYRELGVATRKMNKYTFKEYIVY